MSFTLYIKTQDPSLSLLYINHKSALDGDSGIDLFLPTDSTIKRRSISNKIDLRIQCKMVDNESKQAVSYWLLPRSSIGKTGIRQCNSMGLIDSGYRGNIMAYVDNVDDSDYICEVGDRLFQIAAPTLGCIRIKVVDDLGETTERGNRGFGSSGK